MSCCTKLQTITLKVGITCDIKAKTKRPISGFITKLYELIIEDLEKTKEHKKHLKIHKKLHLE